MGVFSNTYRPSGLGFVAQKKRVIKPIAKYAKYFTRANDKTEDTHVGYLDVFGVLRKIEEIVKENVSTVAAICEGEFRDSKGQPELKKIWQWVYDHIDYKEDEAGNEQLRSPWRLFKDQIGDCDCYTIFIACCLTYFKIPHYLRVIERHNAGAFHHIYVIVPKVNQVKGPRNSYTVLDPVMDKFDDEPDGITTKYDYPMMKVTYLNGLGNTPVDNTAALQHAKAEMEAYRNHLINNPGIVSTEDQQFLISGLGHILDNWEDPILREAAFDRLIAMEAQAGLAGLDGWFKELKKDVEKVADKVGDAIKDGVNAVADAGKTVLNAGQITLLAPARLAFLGLLRANVVGIASQFRIGLMTEAEATSNGISKTEWQLRVSRLNSALEKWDKLFGGKVSEFKDQVMKGSTNKPLFEQKIPGFNGMGTLLGQFIPEQYGFYDYNVLPVNGLGAAGEIAAAIATATPIIAAIVPLIKDLKAIKDIVAPPKPNTSPAPTGPNSSGDGAPPLFTNNDNPDPDEKKSDIPWGGIAIAGGVIVTGIALYLNQKDSTKSINGLGSPEPVGRNKRIKITI